MQYPIIDNLIYAYLRNGWTGLDIGLKWIKPNANTYFDLGINNIDLSFNATFLLEWYEPYGALFGARTASQVQEYQINSFQNGIFRYGDDTTGNIEIPLNTIVECGFNAQTSTFYRSWGTDIIKAETIITPNNVVVFALNTNGRVEQFGTGFRLYNLKFIKNNNTLNLKPILKDGIVLLKDLSSTIVFYPSVNNFSYEIDNYNDIAYNDISHRLKLPLPHYFPHPVIDALISAADGQQTEEENEILRHYLTPLGIGGI